MKINHCLIFLIGIICLNSCRLDNYGYPDSGLYGSIIDAETGELVPQDIIEGTKIYFVELGYDNPPIQQMVIKNNGEYKNSMMFAGRYRLYTSIDSNFAPVGPVEIDVNGQTAYDIKVFPFIRISNTRIYRTGDKVKANFTLSQSGYDNVSSVAIFASTQPVVGAYINDAQVVIPLGQHYSEPAELSIEMDLSAFPSIKSGKTYYFRVGALISIGGAKYNYSNAVPIEL